jgi:hypothetical protein
VLAPLKKGAGTDNSSGLAVVPFPASTQERRLTDEVLAALKKRAGTNNSSDLAAIPFPVSTIMLTSLLTDEVLDPLKEGATTNNSPGLSPMIVPAYLGKIQQSTTLTFATTDATNHPKKWEDNSLIRDTSDLTCHVSKKGHMKSPRLIPKTNQGKGHGEKFQNKRWTDHWYDGAPAASSRSHRQKRASQYLSATKGPKGIPKNPNRKAH